MENPEFITPTPPEPAETRIRFVGGPLDGHRITLPAGFRVPWTITLGYWLDAPLGEVVYQEHVELVLTADRLGDAERIFRLADERQRRRLAEIQAGHKNRSRNF